MADPSTGFPLYLLPGHGDKSKPKGSDPKQDLKNQREGLAKQSLGLMLEGASVHIPSSYICAQCGAENDLKKSDVVRCTRCGHRILYKKRVGGAMMYEAR